MVIINNKYYEGFEGEIEIDLIYKKNEVSGLETFLEVARSMSAFQEIKFTSDDIVRSSLVRDFIIACEKKGLLPGN